MEKNIITQFYISLGQSCVNIKPLYHSNCYLFRKRLHCDFEKPVLVIS